MRCHLKGTSSNIFVVHHLGQLAQLARALAAMLEVLVRVQYEMVP